jgi:hypothetical protein
MKNVSSLPRGQERLFGSAATAPKAAPAAARKIQLLHSLE